MKIRLSKIKAFTLNEMIVVLLITVIVVGMAFSVLNLVQRQMGGIAGIYDVKLETNMLRQSLWADFNRYSYIVYNGKEERLYLSNELDTKYYEITENGLVTQRDTFNIRFQSKAFYFNNQERTTGEVDAIELKTSKETGHQQIFVYKQNAAATYINQ
jgi:hypothetical protein